MGGVQGSFCCGLVYGFVAAGFIAMVLSNIREARLKMGLKDRSLNNFPDAAQPNMTSSGVVNTSQEAMFRYVMWIIALIVIIVMVVGGIFYIIV
jgi:ABC-type antimicrobial peptide transport system permease subunit